MIALVDYGAGNLASVRKGLAVAGAEVFVPTTPAELTAARGVVIPGVGHFDATRSLDEPWRLAVTGAIGRGTPVLGICLGMQWLFAGSDEAPDVPGLGAFPGRMTRLPSQATDGSRLKVPHVGWNMVDAGEESGSSSDSRRALAKLLDGQFVYFTHTYAAPLGDACAGRTTHGVTFAAAVARGSVWGVQFHPEKSGAAGLALLRSFVERTR